MTELCRSHCVQVTALHHARLNSDYMQKCLAAQCEWSGFVSNGRITIKFAIICKHLEELHADLRAGVVHRLTATALAADSVLNRAAGRKGNISLQENVHTMPAAAGRNAPGHQQTLDGNIQVPIRGVEAADIGSVSLQPCRSLFGTQWCVSERDCDRPCLSSKALV